MLFGTTIQESRYHLLRRTFESLAHLIRDCDVLDFGGEALSVLPIMECAPRSVVATQPDATRVGESNRILKAQGRAPCVIQTGYEASIPFGEESFDTVLANAVFEHIPQPRGAYIRECWRVLKRGGHFVINETPNKYFPIDIHTTKLPFIPWLPSRVSHVIAARLGRLAHVKDSWEASGWRGLGYFEMTAPISGYTLVPENRNRRHRTFTRLGIPASIIDPYPLWILRKT
jgi:SAM-dependent methyltransferase